MSLEYLRNQVTEPAALANVATLLAARGRWNYFVEALTSGYDLLFTLPRAVAPHAESVTVDWVAGSSHVTRSSDHRVVEETTATPNTVRDILDGFLERLVSPTLVCRDCGEIVELNADRFEVFERMHYACFHYQFEHIGDHDIECTAGGCPAALIGPRTRPDSASDALVEEILEALRGSELARTSHNVRIECDSPGVLSARFDERTYLVTIRDDPHLR